MAKQQRARGTGQILKRTYGYLVRVYLGQDEVGRNKYLNQKVRGSKTEAQKVLNKLLGKRDGGELVEDTRTTLDEWLDTWLGYVGGSVRDSTYKDYETLLRLYVREPLGEKRLIELTKPQIQQVISGMSQRGLKPRTVKYTHSVLRKALNDAIEEGLLYRNPAKKITLPTKERQPLRALSQEQVDSFLSVAEGTRWYPLYALLLFTGMRPSEALALQWSDIDWMRRKVSITKMISRNGKGWKFQDPKSKESRREISIGQTTTQILLEHQEKQKASGVPNEHGLVFIGETGEPVDRRNILRRDFRPLLKRAGLSEKVRLYDLRHTYATLRLLNNDNVKFVSAALGHANIKLTLETYQHYLPGMDDGANDRVEERFYRRESEQPAAAAN